MCSFLSARSSFSLAAASAIQSFLQGFGVGGIRVLCEEILVCVFCNEFQQFFVSDQSEEMLQYKSFNPILPDGPLGAELFLLGTADVVVMLHLLLTGSTDTGHAGTAFAAEYLAEEDVIHFRFFVCACFLMTILLYGTIACWDRQVLLNMIES